MKMTDDIHRADSPERRRDLLPVAACAAICFLTAAVFDLTEGTSNTILTILGLSLTVGAAACRAVSGERITEQEMILFLSAVAFLLRFNYVLYTPVNLTEVVRQHDVGSFGALSCWQADYIEWFYNHPFQLPEDPTLGQFYHPPAHFWLAALWMRLFTAIGHSYERAVSSLPLLSLFYSSCCLIAADRLTQALSLRGKGRILAFSLAAFHPVFILLSGSINNDILSILFVLLAVDAALRWYRRPSLPGLLLTALWIGLGMMTKLTAALAAIPIALLLLLHLIRSAGRRRRVIAQYCAFAGVSFPLGLWFPLYKYICYGVPLTYVLAADADSAQYIGNYSVTERLFDFSAQPFQSVYENWTAFYEYNPLVALVKTSLFGEWTLAEDGTVITKLAWLLLAVNIVLILVSAAALAVCAVSGWKSRRCGALSGRSVSPQNAAAAPSRDNEDRNTGAGTALFLVVFQLLYFLYYLKFCFDYPLTCSMDFRYIVPTCMIGAATIGMLISRLEEKNSPFRRILLYGIVLSIVFFCCLSGWIYFLLGI